MNELGCFSMLPEKLRAPFASLRSIVVGVCQVIAHEPRSALRWAAIAGFVVSLFIVTLDSSVSPVSPLRTYIRKYIASLNANLIDLRLPEKGAFVTLVQCLVGSIGLASALGARSYATGLVVLIAAGAPRTVLTIAARRRRAAIDKEVHTFALGVSNALRTTSSLGDALRIATEMTEGPLQQELEVMFKHMALGLPLEDGLRWLATRTALPSVEVVVSALLVGRRIGGNLPDTLEKVAGSLREHRRLENRISASVKSAHLQVAIMMATMLAIIGIVSWAFPDVNISGTAEGRELAIETGVMIVLALFLAMRATKVSV